VQSDLSEIRTASAIALGLALVCLGGAVLAATFFTD
jgi:hypothetical protein